jgi:hypothetical protein
MDKVTQLFTTYIEQPILAIVKLFAGSSVGLVVLIVVFIIAVTIRAQISKRALVVNTDRKNVKDKTKPQTNPQNNPYTAVLDIISILTVMLMLLVVNVRYGPQIKDFFEIDTTTPTDTTTTPQTTPQQTAPQQTTPNYVAPKRLYYSIGCYGCWASGCVNEGYSYNGYDGTTYNYYDNLCHVCSCNSINGVSFWK